MGSGATANYRPIGGAGNSRHARITSRARRPYLRAGSPTKLCQPVGPTRSQSKERAVHFNRQKLRPPSPAALDFEYAQFGPIEFRRLRRDALRRKHRRATAKDLSRGSTEVGRASCGASGGLLREEHRRWASARGQASEVAPEI